MKPPKVRPLTKQIWELYLEGHRVIEIADMLGVQPYTVSNAVAKGRNLGIIENKRLYTLPYLLQTHNLQVGRLKQDVVEQLDRRQVNWLVERASSAGCESLAEYVTEIIRDEFEQEDERERAVFAERSEGVKTTRKRRY